jgi:hypothetical protein
MGLLDILEVEKLALKDAPLRGQGLKNRETALAKSFLNQSRTRPHCLKLLFE